MFSLKQFLATSVLVVMAVEGLTACGGGEPTLSTPTPTSLTSIATPAPPTATSIAEEQATTNPSTGPIADILFKTVTSMKNVKSYHGTFTTQMAGNTVDSVFDFQAPDKMHMNYKYSGGNVDLIIVGSEAYAKPPGAKDYIAIPSGGYNVGGINSAQVVILLNSAQNGQVVGDEQVQGVNTTHIRFTYDTNRVIDEMAQQAGQATPTPEVSLGTSSADAWIDKSTGYIVQYTTSAKMSSGIVTSMVVLSKFNEPINPPIVLPTVAP